MRSRKIFLESGATNEALITPAGYAFSQWGLITVLSEVTAVAVLHNGLSVGRVTRPGVSGGWNC
jgi:hypothetical protein